MNRNIIGFCPHTTYWTETDNMIQFDLCFNLAPLKKEGIINSKDLNILEYTGLKHKIKKSVVSPVVIKKYYYFSI